MLGWCKHVRSAHLLKKYLKHLKTETLGGRGRGGDVFKLGFIYPPPGAKISLHFCTSHEIHTVLLMKISSGV